MPDTTKGPDSGKSSDPNRPDETVDEAGVTRADEHRGTRVDDDTVLSPDEEAVPDTSVDISVEEVADLPPGKMLEVDDVTLRFGGVTALDGVSFHINTGEILGLIGPNGAGKTTCFNVMTGVYQPTSGEARFMGEPLGKRQKFQITKLGIARTFQNIRLFHNMTAMENVLVGADAHHSTGMGSALFRLPKHKAEEAEGNDRAYDIRGSVRGAKLRVVVTAHLQGATVGSAGSKAVKVRPRGR